MSTQCDNAFSSININFYFKNIVTIPFWLLVLTPCHNVKDTGKKSRTLFQSWWSVDVLHLREFNLPNAGLENRDICYSSFWLVCCTLVQQDEWTKKFCSFFPNCASTEVCKNPILCLKILVYSQYSGNSQNKTILCLEKSKLTTLVVWLNEQWQI